MTVLEEIKEEMLSKQRKVIMFYEVLPFIQTASRLSFLLEYYRFDIHHEFTYTFGYVDQPIAVMIDSYISHLDNLPDESKDGFKNFKSSRDFAM